MKNYSLRTGSNELLMVKTTLCFIVLNIKKNNQAGYSCSLILFLMILKSFVLILKIEENILAHTILQASCKTQSCNREMLQCVVNVSQLPSSQNMIM